MRDTYDVAIVGGGTAGSVAAIQAGRAGASTLLVEKNGILGGTAVTAGVNFPGLFHAHGRQVIAGIGWDMVCEAVRAAGDPLPDFAADCKERHWLHHIRVDPFLLAALLDEHVLQAGVDLLLHTMLAGVQRLPDRWRVTVCTKEGLCHVSARVLIDCTGDANAVALAGYELERNTHLQPGTIMVRAGGYDCDALDMDAIEAAFLQAVREGRVRASDLGRTGRPCADFLARRGFNRTHVPHIDGATSEGKTQAEIEARRCLVRIHRFFRAQPGLENFHYETFSTECGIRESRTIRGNKTITAEDYISGRRWEDGLCYSFYPIDVHRDNGLGIDIRHLERGVVPTIPRGAMLPSGSSGLIAAGRCIASDKEANSAVRAQATCMATGQAAGAMAALSARTGLDVEALAMADVYDLLRAHGAIVPGDLE